MQTTDTEQGVSRSASATSSLDPYYFGAHTPSGSPVPPMPSGNMFPKTPDLSFATEPATPQRDPSSIDRRGLVGVGELATPRWARGERREQVEIDDPVDEVDEEDLVESREGEYSEGDLPDSPWTIEAIDGEQDDEDKVCTDSRYSDLTLKALHSRSWKLSQSHVPCVLVALSPMRVVVKRSYTRAIPCQQTLENTKQHDSRTR